MDAKRCWHAFLIISILALLILGALVIKAMAHDWYPIECCHSLDCAPVDSYAYISGALYDEKGNPVANPLPHLVVTTKIGTAVVPDNLARRESKDNRMHACIRAGELGQGHVTCIFMPAGM